MEWMAFLVAAGGMPPERFLYEPAAYSVERVSTADIGRACRMPNPEYRLLGCTHGPTLRVFIRDDISGVEYEAVLHHEWAHLNGWRHD